MRKGVKNKNEIIETNLNLYINIYKIYTHYIQ